MPASTVGRPWPTPHARTQRPQPTQASVPKRSGKYLNLCMTRWRQRADCSARGLWPLACLVKRPNEQQSQLRRRSPPFQVASSTMSKQWQVGQR